MSQTPKIFYADGTYTLTLFRPNETGAIERSYYTFDEHALTIFSVKEDEISPKERSQIKGPVAEDGFLYYLYATPYHGERDTFVWLKDVEEARAIERELLFIEENEDAEPDHEFYEDETLGAY
jgi:hypothetical protein